MADQMGDATTTGQTRADRWINMAQQRFCLDSRLPQLRRETTLALVADQYDYILPADILIPSDVWTVPAEDSRIHKVNFHNFKFAQPNAIASTDKGLPSVWMDHSWVPVSAQPTGAGTVTATSSSTSTDNGVKLTVEGIVSGEVDREQITLAGVGGAGGTATTTKQFSIIHSISKDVKGVGRITLVSNTGTPVTLGIIGPLQTRKQYIKVRLFPIPDAVQTVYLDYMPWLPDLVNDSDMPLIPDRHHTGILSRALMYAYKFQKNQKSFQQEAGFYQDLVDAIRQETGADEGLIKAWRWGGDIDVGNTSPEYDWDMFLRSIYGGW